MLNFMKESRCQNQESSQNIFNFLFNLVIIKWSKIRINVEFYKRIQVSELEKFMMHIQFFSNLVIIKLNKTRINIIIYESHF